MTHDDHDDQVEFDELVSLALASAAATDLPRPDVKRRLLASLVPPPIPSGFSFRFDAASDWIPHAVPGIKMKVLALNRDSGYATLLLDVSPGTTFPAHHHTGAEECYVLSGSLYTCGRKMTAGDFLHADPDTDHRELWSPEGCRVLLVVPPDDDIPAPAR